jgi:hypothetical protein
VWYVRGGKEQSSLHKYSINKKKKHEKEQESRPQYKTLSFVVLWLVIAIYSETGEIQGCPQSTDSRVKVPGSLAKLKKKRTGVGAVATEAPAVPSRNSEF